MLKRAVNSRLGRADNARFLEHFRYLIVASNLLSEQAGQAATKSAAPSRFSLPAPPEPAEYGPTTFTTSGAVVIGVVAFALVWLVNWARRTPDRGFNRGRIALVLALLVILATVGYGHIRRQLLQYLRQEAVSAASNVVTNFQAFEGSTSAALMLVQEVELVSRGYRL